MSTLLDCVVVGSGPAGLSAAINLHQRGKTVAVLGSGRGYLEKAEQVDNYLGLPGLSGGKMLDAFAAHAAELNIVPKAGRVANILPFGDRFMLNVANDIIEARSVILAIGTAKAKPIVGEAELLGHGLSYCATCDGMLYRGKKVLVWGLSGEAGAEANFLASIGCTVVYVGAKQPEDLNEQIEYIKGSLKAVGGDKVVQWAETAGKRIEVEGVFILRPAIAPDTLLNGLAIEKGSVVVDRRCATNIAGVFAAGDVTGAPLQVSKAVGEGLVAALSAAEYLDSAAK